ncbi:hypothetical protein ACFVIM_21330 [Streptomyces sp. NPDC057638]|uniref:hypothetical protein n=1 Tax=Streptomyces sp. NPDC057638 TaxID=3346190 RepID=UPI003685935B
MPRAITAQNAADYIGIALPDPATYDGYALGIVVNAVNVLVPSTVPRVRALPPSEEWPVDVTLAAHLMAARLFARRRSPTGVATYTETGPAYVARWDPDLERLLQVGKWAPPGGA